PATLILWARLTLLRGQSRTKLGFGQLAFLRIALPTCRKDVVDRVRASARERRAMVHLKRPRLAAIRALAVVTRHQRKPLGTRELTFRCASAGTIGVALGAKHFGMSLVVRRHDRLVLLSVTSVVETLRSTPLFGM